MLVPTCMVVGLAGVVLAVAFELGRVWQCWIFESRRYASDSKIS